MFILVTVTVVSALLMLSLMSGTSLSDSSKSASEEPGLVRVCDGLEFPEGPAWDGKNSIYVSNCQSNYITRVSLKGVVERRWMTGGGGEVGFKKTNGMTFHKDGSLFACDYERNAIIRISPQKKCEVYADSCDGQAFKGPNDLAFDPHGNLYFTDPVGSGKNNPVGAVYRVEQGTRKVAKVASGMAFPNGLAFTADAKHLYVCESQLNRVVRFDVKPDGSLDNMRLFADLSPDGSGEPDGMALDIEGNLWIAHYGAHTVLAVNPKGVIVRTIRIPHSNNQGPTNVEFAGQDMRMLYISDPGTSALYALHADVPGLSLFCAPKASK